jgi:nucleoside-diphosphate-sugar epimerase
MKNHTITAGTMLVTGGTGVVGSELVRRARQAGWDVLGCSRRGGPGCVQWDMTAGPPPATLHRHWDVVVHTAARPRRWNTPPEVAWRANVGPLDHLGKLVGADSHVVLISTAYATGHTNSVLATDLDDYRNSYEWSKAAAERAVAELFGTTTIIRPPLVIGRRSDGGIDSFFGMYTILLALTTSMLPVLIADPDGRLEFVSTTDVADCSLRAAHGGRPAATVVHTLGRGGDALLTRDAFDITLDELNSWRTARGGERLEWPRYVNQEQWQRFFRPFAERHLNHRQNGVVRRLEPFIPYLNIREPLAVNWPVPPIEDCLRRSVGFWADRHQDMAGRDLRPWVADAPTPGYAAGSQRASPQRPVCRDGRR